MTKKTEGRREPLQVPPEVADRGRHLLEAAETEAEKLRASSPEKLLQLLADAERLREAHGAFLRPFYAWATLASTLADASKEQTIRECPEVARFVYLLYQLAADGAVHSRSRGGPLRALESMIAALRASSRSATPRAFVLSEWAAHAEAYEFNKTQFAQDYRGRVLNEYGLKVSVRTIAERWLKS